VPVTILSAKKKGPNTFCLDKAQNALFNFGLSLVRSVTSWGLLLPQILRFCRLTFSNKWNVSSLLKTILALRISSSSSLERKLEQNV
jgi:hypothetical protein